MTVNDRRTRRHLQSAASSLNATGFCSLYGAIPVADPNVTLCVWAGDGYCDDGGPGHDYSECAYGTDFPDCGASPPRGFDCQCAAGNMWNMAGTHCVSMHWQYTAADPDTVAGTAYFTELESTLKRASRCPQPSPLAQR